MRKELEEAKAKKGRKSKGRVIRDTPSPEPTYDKMEDEESSLQPEDAITASQEQQTAEPMEVDEPMVDRKSVV